MTTIFSNTLVQLRKDAGFSSSYRFYHGNDGKNLLKMTYRNYLRIEQGKTLPPLERLGSFILALRMEHGRAEANTLVTAWLKTMLGEETFKTLIAPLVTIKPGAPELSPEQNAMKKALAKTRYYLTLEQIEIIHSNTDNYLCYLATTCDERVWTTKDLAQRLELTEPAAKQALKALASIKIVKEIKKNAYKCQLEKDALVTYPNVATLPHEIRQKMSDCDKKLAATGREVYPHYIILRADENDFRNYFPILGLSVSTAANYSVTEKTDNSALFMVEGRITKLRDF